MSVEDYLKDPLWLILVEAVHTNVLYSHHKFYTQSVYLSENPDAIPRDLASALNISLGEAMVILYELKTEKEKK